ncbi:MAG: M23 family metallopeptidase [Cyanobacteria bacterium P01_D01_bin.105]
MTTPMFLKVFLLAATQVAGITGLRMLTAPSAYAQGSAQGSSQNSAQVSDCPAALARMSEYTVVPGDTITTVAATYRLAPSTLRRFNPNIGNSLVPGSTLTIPPFNGTVVNVSPGETWQILADRYNSRADLLFEVNGCVANVPNRIFVPGALPAGAPSITTTSNTTGRELGYPLADEAEIVMSYGWQPHSTRDELVFNSGIAFAISMPTEVLATAEGTVAFAGDQTGYGRLVVINHADGLQTRYANLSSSSVSVGQSVAAKDLVGQVGYTDSPTFLYFEVRRNSEEGWIAQDPGKYVPTLGLR